MKPKILFIGGTPRGQKLLQLLIARQETVVSAFILKEDEHETIKVAGEIEQLCKEHNIPAVVCKRIDPEQVPQILELQPDVAFVCGWRTLIPGDIYNDISLGCLAAHDSLLPKYRGFAPTSWAIINGEKETGVTLFKISEQGVDAGDIAGQKAVPIGDNETSEDIYPRIINATIKLYRDFLESVAVGTVVYLKQDESRATYTCKRTPADGEIIWSKSSGEIFNLVRALTPPYPYAWTLCNGEKIFIKKACLPSDQLKYSGNIPGWIVAVSDEGVIVSCGQGQIMLKEIISEAGETIKANEKLVSITTTLGT